MMSFPSICNDILTLVCDIGCETHYARAINTRGRELSRISMFREQLIEDRNQNMNRLHREIKIYFPEYKDAFGKIDGAFCIGTERSAIPGRHLPAGYKRDP